MMRTLESLLADHAFFKGMDPDCISFMAGCGANVSFDAGQRLFREGEPANQFYLLRHGKVALETFIPERGPLVIQTIAEGDVLGWSWLFPPHRWRFDARAMEVTRAIAFDGACLRDKSHQDYRLGCELMERFAQIVVERLQATRLQLVDVYGSGSRT